LPRPRTRSAADIALPPPAPDGEIYVTGRTAARVVGVTPRAIRQWRDKGWLTEAGQEPDGRRLLLYRLRDVLAADCRARARTA